VPNINKRSTQQCSRCRTLNTVSGHVWPLLYSSLNSDLMQSSADHTRHLILVSKG